MPFVLADRDQGDLLGYSLSDFVEPDAKCRFVLSLVQRLDLSALYDRYSNRGAEAFDPAMMLALWFYAYCEGITSTRKLEERCLRDTHFIYLSANLRPDHTSFSRFRKNHLDLMGAYFVELVRVAAEQNVSDFALLAVDGTRIQAAASAKHITGEEGLRRYLQAVRADLEAYLHECAQMDEAEDSDEDSDDSPPSGEHRAQVEAKIERARAEEERLIVCQAQLAERKASLKAEHRSGHTINLSEPEACVLDKVNGTSRLPAYNAQVVVDVETHLITACDAVQDRNDARQFAPMHQQAEAVLATLGAERGRSYVADAGYHSLDQLAYIDHEGVDAVLADPTPYNRSSRVSNDGAAEATATAPNAAEVMEASRFTRSDFAYDVEADRYTCPAGERLTYQHTRKRGTRCQRIYQANACQACALRARCQGEVHRLRRIFRDEAEHLAEAMHERLQHEEGKARLKARRASVEPVIGNLKANLGFRRFRLRGLKQVKGELYLMAIAHNINKLFRIEHARAILLSFVRLLGILRLYRPAYA